MTERIERYAELIVKVGANIEPGQELYLYTAVEHRDLARALARQAYRAGAEYVNVLYTDAHLQKALIQLAPDEALTYSPEWLKAFVRGMAGNALIATIGDAEPDLMADVDGERIGRAIQQELTQMRMEQMRDSLVNWCGVGAPNAGWATQVYGEPDVDRLWDAVAFCMRLDEPDPVAAWQEHLARLAERTTQLNEMRLDALRYRGPGTDLTVGLIPDAHWVSGGGQETASGIRYVANMPTEEVFTSPDARRTEGAISMTLPLPLQGQIVRGLQLTFEGGRAVKVEAESGAEIVRSHFANIENADRLGEVALVTKESRVGQLGTLFYNPLFDENVTCHVAYGAGFPFVFDGAPDERLNVANIHLDFMVGGPELEVDGVLSDGTVVPLIREETWQR